MTKRKPIKHSDVSSGEEAAARSFAPKHLSMGLLAFGSLVLLSLIFEPIGIWPLAFVSMVPWLVLVGGARLAPRVYFYSYVMGLAFFLINLRWLHTATAMDVPYLPFRVGWGYLAMCAYLAAYFPFVAIPMRHVVRRRCWPLALAFPVVWTGCEMLRAVVISGFPWLYLSHSLHTALPLIQISDLVGAYGVTFMVAAVNGALADLAFASWERPGRGRWKINVRGARFSLVFAGSLVFVTLVYGVVQLSRGTTTDGPKVALVQGDFIDTIHPGDAEEHDRFGSPERMRVYLSMIEAAATQQPDVFVLPESPWRMFLNPEERNFHPLWVASFNELQRRSTQYQAYLITGSATRISTPDDVLAKERRYNSATIFRPDGSEPDRYDKIHLVYFGETVPFRFGKLRFVYFWLNRMMPFAGPDGTYEYSLFRGEDFKRFDLDLPSRLDRRYRFSVPICYEDVMPYVSREFVFGGSNEKRVDFLVNISNDGWFGRGIQQPQHLAICAFRAVENRVGIARAVNTGGSAIIDPNGRIHHRVTGDAETPWPGNCGYEVANVRVDSRFTFYSRYGDWFAWGCALLWLALFVDYWILRVRAHRERDG